MTAPSIADFIGGSRRFPKIIAWDSLTVGTTVEGIIVEEPTMTQQTDIKTKKPKFFPPDKETGERAPMWQMSLVIDTGDPDPAIEGDTGIRTIMIRGGFKCETSMKCLADELRRNGLTEPRVGDHWSQTRIPNYTGGDYGRTHQFKCVYTKAEDLPAEATKAVAKKTPAKKAASAPASATWED